MCRQFWMIAKVWAYRPMMWLVAIAALIAVAASVMDRNRTVLRSAFNIPGANESTWSVKLTPTSTLTSGEKFRQSAESGEVDTSVEGIDLTSMNLSNSTNSLHEFASLERALANYPSVRWIRFDTDQIQHVSNETLSKLSELTTIIIHDNQITQADIDQLSKFSRLQMLVLETVDFPASLNTLSRLPSLDTLVLSHSTFDVADSPMESLFRPEVLSQTHELVHLRRLVLMPQWLPGEFYFAGSKTADPACDPILKENAAKLLPRHTSLTDLWLGIAKYERPGRDLATVQAAMPDVNVRSAQYNETGISRVGFGAIWIVVLTWMCMFNLGAHFSTPQRRVIPNYKEPHQRFVFGFAVLVVVVSTGAIQSPVAVAWLPAITVSVVAVALGATLMTNLTGNNNHHLGRVRSVIIGWVPSAITMALIVFPLIRPVLKQAIPAMEPAMAHFLGGHHPVLAIVIVVAGLPAIYWMISRFTDYDRLNAEAGLPPIITGSDCAKQGEILSSRLHGNQRSLDASVDAWHSKLDAIKSKPKGWLRDIQLDWMGESTITFVLWTGLLVGATVVTILTSLFSARGREFAATYVCLGIGVALIIPLVSSLSRQDVSSLELLFPNSRAQFMRRRTISIAATYAYLFAGLFVQVAIVRYFCFHTLNLESPVRAAIVLVPITMAGTGLVLWGTSIRNIVALGLLVVVGLVILTFASSSVLDFRWIEHGENGQQIHAFVTSPLFYAVSYLVAGILLWTGYRHLSRCELGLAD